MKRLTRKSGLLFPLSVLWGAGVLVVLPAFAQDADCTRLGAMIKDVEGSELRDEFKDAQALVNADTGTECRTVLDRIAIQGGITRENQEVQSLNTIVDVEQQATIEGQVQVTLPDPEVSIEQGQAEVSVTSEAPTVKVAQGQPVIQVRQAQPIIRVSMAQPTITVEQPAPEITVIMPDPDVEVSNAQPQVLVNIPEPQVTVRQGEPSLSVDLGAEPVEAVNTADSPTRGFNRVDDAGIMTITATGVAHDESNATINYLEPEQEATVTYEGVEPKVEYIAADPQIEMESAGEPTINVVQSGEPKIVIKQAMNEQDTTAQRAMEAPQSSENPMNPNEVFAPNASRVLEGDMSTVSAADVVGMDVINARDEELGVVDRIVKNGNETYVIIAHGGWFFGLNDKEVAFPVNDVVINGEQILLRGLSEEQIASMPDYDYENEVSLESDETLDMTVIKN